MFARVLGPFLVIVDVTAVVRAPHMRGLLSEFVAESLWTWVVGAFILLGGLTIIALHQYWRGAAAIIVSLVGWLIALRGLFLLTFPHTFASVANSMVSDQTWWQALCIIFTAVGLYLTYVGWMPAPSRPASQTPRSTGDLPRAA
jgi:hypothetical protein